MAEDAADSANLSQDKTSSPPLWRKVVEIVSLIIASLVLLAVFITSGLAAAPNAENYGFANQTGAVSDEFYLQVTPAGWTFAIWGIIYTWQGLWILYSWSFVFRPSTPRTVSWITLLLYSCANVGNISWIYLWGNNYPQVAFAFIVLIWAALLAAVGVETVHLYKVTPLMSSGIKNKVDLWITRLLVVNGICIYATWVTVATLLNLGIVLQYYGDVADGTTGTVVLWLLSVEVLAYFALENTILDRFARFVFIVYPVLIWALSGSLSAHWGREDPVTNPVLTLMILLLVILLFITRGVLWIVFAFLRPLGSTYLKLTIDK